MKYFSFLLFVLLVACSKDQPVKEVAANKPEDPIIAGIKAWNESDSMGMINTYCEDLKASISRPGDTTMREIMKFARQKRHTDLQIVRVQTDSLWPNTAMVYVKETITKDTSRVTYDSLFYYVTKENNKWKLSSLWPNKMH